MPKAYRMKQEFSGCIHLYMFSVAALDMIDYRFEQNHSRVAAYDGSSLAGEAVFHASGNYWVLDHTGVEAAYGGQGIAGQLLTRMAEEAGRAGKKILPVCSYGKHFFEKHKEYKDILAI